MPRRLARMGAKRRPSTSPAEPPSSPSDGAARAVVLDLPPERGALVVRYGGASRAPQSGHAGVEHRCSAQVGAAPWPRMGAAWRASRVGVVHNLAELVGGTAWVHAGGGPSGRCRQRGAKVRRGSRQSVARTGLARLGFEKLRTMPVAPTFVKDPRALDSWPLFSELFGPPHYPRAGPPRRSQEVGRNRARVGRIPATV